MEGPNLVTRTYHFQPGVLSYEDYQNNKWEDSKMAAVSFSELTKKHRAENGFERFPADAVKIKSRHLKHKNGKEVDRMEVTIGSKLMEKLKLAVGDKVDLGMDENNYQVQKLDEALYTLKKANKDGSRGRFHIRCYSGFTVPKTELLVEAPKVAKGVLQVPFKDDEVHALA